MTSNLIVGIDEVIKGLNIIKQELSIGGGIVKAQDSIVDAVKEAVEEVIEEVLPKVGAPEEEVEIEEVEPEEAPEEIEEEVEQEPEEEVEEEEELDREAELTAMKYNELKALAGTIEGARATGKKVEIIASIMEAEANLEEVEEIEEEDEEIEETNYSEQDYEEFTDFLSDLTLDDLKELVTEAGLELPKKVLKATLVKDLVVDLDVLIKSLEALGYYDEDEEETEEEDVEEVIEEDNNEDEMIKVADEFELNSYTVQELADICTDFDLSTKGRKQALIDRIVKGIMDGTIEFEDDEEDEEPEVKETRPLKKVEEVKDPVVQEAEDDIEDDLREQYKSKKLKDNAIKKFLDKYYEGDPDSACKDTTKEGLLECYIEIHKALVDDEGEVNDFEEPYERDGEYNCCGREIKELDNGNLYCQVCGTEYQS